MNQEAGEIEIIDPDQDSQESPIVQYEITSYGADFTVDGLIRKINRGDIYTPDFQRNYVWNISEASKLVESLLLGLPVPGVFLAREGESNKLLIIDGQQRLKSLQYFINGYFDPKDDAKTKKVFRLTNVQKPFDGKSFSDLEDSDRRMIEDSIIHATVIKQESPAEDNTAIYHVFERLNSGGRKLTPQEIRAAIYGGHFNSVIALLNHNSHWRALFGPISPRLKDQELILRFFAVRYSKTKYSKPMNEFLNKYNKRNRFIDDERATGMINEFGAIVKFLFNCIGKSVFRPEGVFNVSVFESIMVGISKISSEQGLPECSVFKKNYHDLINDEEYKLSISRATSDESVFYTRQDITMKFLSRRK